MINSTNENKERLKEIIHVLSKYEIVKEMNPKKLRAIIEDLGPMFVKLGQVMSMRSDILPSEYCDELIKLRTEVKPMNISEVKAVIKEEYNCNIEDIYMDFNEVPLGSASIAQVHSATLYDGTPVVLKIQRPNVQETMCRDINLLRKATKILNIAIKLGTIVDFDMILNELWDVSQQEMNFLMEAQNIEKFYKLNEDILYATCPKVYKQYTTSKILVMEYIDGVQIDNITALKSLGYELEDIGEKICENYIKQVVDDGFFHADPHPGNIRIRNGEIVWIDLGMMGTLSNRDKALFKSAIEAIASNDILKLKEVILKLGIVAGSINHSKLYNDISNFINKYGEVEVAEMDLGEIVDELIQLANEHNIAIPNGVSIFAKGLVTLQGVVAVLSLRTNIIEIFATHIATDKINSFDIKKELSKSGKTLYLSSQRLLELPKQISQLLDATTKGELKVNVEFAGIKKTASKIDRMVNKLVICVMMTGLLISSSLICNTDMSPKIFGLPILAAIGYTISTVLGAILVYDFIRYRKH